MADKVTCCPHCNTSFRITDSQLASAKGAVRCGSCLQVFRASDHLVNSAPAAPDDIDSNEPNAHSTDAHGTDPHETDARVTDIHESDTHDTEFHNPEPFSPAATDSTITEQTHAYDDDDDLLISDNMDEDFNTDEDFSAEFLVDTQAPQTRGGMFDRQITAKTQEPEKLDDDSWAEALLEEDSERQEPVFTITGEAESNQAEQSGSEYNVTAYDPADDATQISETELELNLDTEEPLTAGRSLLDETHHFADAEEQPTPQSQNRKILNSITGAPVEMEWHPEQSHWPKRLFWGSLNLLVAALLVLQIGWFNIDTFSRQEPYRSYYQALCPTLGCEVPPSHDMNLIKSYNLVVRSHPDAQNALAIDSILLNTATFSQPFPKLTLAFTDIDNNPVAHRIFEPSEYLAGELAGVTEMPSQRPIHIALEILDPGVEAVNYQLAIVNP